MRFIHSDGYIRLRGVSVLGARLHVHIFAIVVSVLLLVGWIRQPGLGLELVACYYGLILLHEAGHAAMARRLGYAAPDIYLGLIHGLCEVDHPDSLRDDALIAWGGVLAQLAVAVPLVALAQVDGITAQAAWAIPIGVFGYFSLWMAALNLVPAFGLDGTKAWRLLPILLADRRAGAKAKKAMRDLMKRLK